MAFFQLQFIQDRLEKELEAYCQAQEDPTTRGCTTWPRRPPDGYIGKELLITGVSGYVGGTILASILKLGKTGDYWVNYLSISVLVRNESQAHDVQMIGSVRPIIIDDFDETEVMKRLGTRFDIIIHAGAGLQAAAAKALITGMGFQKTKGNHPVYYIHISGASNLSDRPHTEGYVDTHRFDDEEDIYSYEKYRQSREAYQQRETDITVVETGEALGVHTYIIMAPTIYGLGTGPCNKFSRLRRAMIENAMKSGVVSVPLEGKALWSHVHVKDVASLFVTLLEQLAVDTDIPSGRKGIYFCETGEHSHREFSQRLAKAGYELGILPTPDVKEVTLQKAANELTMGNTLRAELSFASNARCKASLGRKLGWIPLHAAEWETTFHTEIQEFIKDHPRKVDAPRIVIKIED